MGNNSFMQSYKNNTLDNFIKDKKGIIFYYFEGIGGSLNTLSICCQISEQYNIPLYIYPNYRSEIPDNKLYNTRGYTFLLEFFQPTIPFTLLPDDFNPNDLKDCINTNETRMPCPNNLKRIFKYIKITEKIHQFDKEYDKLNKQYNLSERIGAQFRFFSFDHPPLSGNLQIINNLNKKPLPLFLATDNLDFFNSIKKLIKSKDIFMLKDIRRVTNQNQEKNIEYVDFSRNDVLNDTNRESNIKAFRNRIQDLKEAYFLAKCKHFFINRRSLFSTVLVPFLRNEDYDTLCKETL